MALTSTNFTIAAGGLALLCLLKHIIDHKTSPTRKTTRLGGPPPTSFLTGALMDVLLHDDPPSVYVSWTQLYGEVFRIPLGIVGSSIVLCDPKAAQHVLSKDTTLYVNTPGRTAFIKQLVGNGLMASEGESHRRQRKTLSPAFANAELRKLTSVFYDSAYKVKEHWETLIAQNDGVEVVVNVQEWANKVSLDSMGKGIFAQDFNTLSSISPSSVAPIAKIFESVAKESAGHFSRIIALLGQVMPILRYLPTKGKRKRDMFSKEGRRIAKLLLEKADDEKVVDENDKLASSLLLKAQRMEAASLEEVATQVTTFLGAGYETTSVTITWLMIELARNPSIQDQLREELNTKYPTQDPTWDELWYETPYLDAVVLENIRLHPILPELIRMAAQDDIIPLSRPVKTAQGNFVDALTVGKGSFVTVPLGTLNRLPVLWGSDAAEFNPGRWLGGGMSDELGAKELQGYKHLLSFSDGPRICLGRHFALAEMKAVLVALSRNFKFEFEDPTKTELEIHFGGFAPRPKMKGSKEASIRLRVRKVE